MQFAINVPLDAHLNGFIKRKWNSEPLAVPIICEKTLQSNKKLEENSSLKKVEAGCQILHHVVHHIFTYS